MSRRTTGTCSRDGRPASCYTDLLPPRDALFHTGGGRGKRQEGTAARGDGQRIAEGGSGRGGRGRGRGNITDPATGVMGCPLQ
jgi:hypothetical protein